MEKRISFVEWESPCGRLTIASLEGDLVMADWTTGWHHDVIRKRFGRLLRLPFVNEETETAEQTIAELEEYFRGERRTFELISDSYIITEALKNAQTAQAFLQTQPNSLELLENAAKLLRGLHNAGMTHGDIKLANFYVQGDKMGFWDLDSAQIFKDRIPQKWIVRDLGRLLSSFIITVDSMSETKPEFMNTVKIARALAQSYGIDEQVFLPSYYSYWLKKMKLKHDFG